MSKTERELSRIQSGAKQFATPTIEEASEKCRGRLTKINCSTCGWYQCNPITVQEHELANKVLAQTGNWKGYCRLVKKPIGELVNCPYWCFKHDRKQMDKMWTQYYAMKNHKPVSLCVGEMYQEKGIPLPAEYENVNFKKLVKAAMKKERAHMKVTEKKRANRD